MLEGIGAGKDLEGSGKHFKVVQREKLGSAERWGKYDSKAARRSKIQGGFIEIMTSGINLRK